MEGYHRSTYGDRFADVYDDWYERVTDTDACVALLSELAAGGGRVLELGVGTGRLAIPLAGRGLDVIGLDASPLMLDALGAKPGGQAVTTVVGDMAEPQAALADVEPFDLVVVAYNTLFLLVDAAAQQRCFAGVAGLLAEGGSFVVEAFVPDTDRPTSAVEPRTIAADRVVLSVSRSDPATQEAMGQHVDITEAGIRLRPWHIRWSTPAQIDEMAAAAGLRLADRWADWARTPFGDDAPTHVSRFVASG